MRRLIPGLALVLAVCGCSSVAPPSAPVPATPADQRAAAPAALAVERRWLQSWFEGTPVRIAQGADGAISVEVPREFSFDPGQSRVKPPLVAVLDKVADSLRRRPQARLTQLAAPDDAASAGPLGLQRAAQIRQHLLARGVPAVQLGKPSATSAPLVQLRLEAAPA